MITKKLIYLSLLLFPTLTSGQELKSVLINSCGTEGANEHFVLKNGNSVLTVNSTNIDLRYGTSSPASTTYTQSLAASGNVNYVDSLNAKLSGSCDFSFVNASVGSNIPADAYFMVMNETPLDTPDYSAWCGNSVGNIYMVFSTDASFSNSGNFANAPSGLRYFRAILNGTTLDYNYGNSWSSNSDGNFVTFNGTGAASTYGNHTNCTPTNITALPVELISFEVTAEGQDVKLSWKTASELNNQGFSIERKVGNADWINMGFVDGWGNSAEVRDYRYEDELLNIGVQYYRLKQIDFDGKYAYSKVQYIRGDAKHNISVYPNPANNTVHIRLNDIDQSSVKLTSLEGSIVYKARTTNQSLEIDLTEYPTGIYFVQVVQNGILETRRLVVQN